MEISNYWNQVEILSLAIQNATTSDHALSSSLSSSNNQPHGFVVTD